LKERLARAAAARFLVSHAMRPPTEVFQSQEPIAEVLEHARASEFHAWPVVDERGVVGVVSLAVLQRAEAEGAGAKPLGQLLDRKAFPDVHDDQSLELALQRLGQADLELIPVVSRANVRELVGIVTLGDILKKYGVGRAAVG
jgi:CBS domain-containing protein